MFRCKGNFFHVKAFVFGQTENFTHEPVGCFLRAAAEVCNFLKKLRKVSGLGKDSRIVSRKLILFLITFHLGFTKFRNGSTQLFNPCIGNVDRWKIRVREVTVIFGILFGTHGVGRFFVVIPAAGFLDNGSAFFDQLDLSLPLALNGSGNGLKGVQVLHLGPCSECLTADFTDRQVDVGTHGAFL